VLRQTKPRPLGWALAQHAAGGLKKGQGLGQGAAGADAALTWAAKAESERDLKCERVCQGNNGAVSVSK